MPCPGSPGLCQGTAESLLAGARAAGRHAKEEGAWQTSSAGAVSGNHPGARQPHLPQPDRVWNLSEASLGCGEPSAVVPCSISRPTGSAQCTLPSPLSNKSTIFLVFFFFHSSHAVCQKDQVAPDASDCYLTFHKLTLHLQGDKQ